MLSFLLCLHDCLQCQVSPSHSFHHIFSPALSSYSSSVSKSPRQLQSAPQLRSLLPTPSPQPWKCACRRSCGAGHPEPLSSKLYTEVCWVPAEGGLASSQPWQCLQWCRTFLCMHTCLCAHPSTTACCSLKSCSYKSVIVDQLWPRQPSELLCHPEGWNCIFSWEPTFPRRFLLPWIHSLRTIVPFRVCCLPLKLLSHYCLIIFYIKRPLFKLLCVGKQFSLDFLVFLHSWGLLSKENWKAMINVSLPPSRHF